MTHYLRTFEHLAPTENERPARRRRGLAWIAVSALALLALPFLRPAARKEVPESVQAKQAVAPRIALAPPGPATTEVVPPVRVVEQQGPKLIERMLAEKFGTPPPKAPTAPPRQPEPPPVAVAKPAVPPSPIMDRPQLAERPPAAEQPEMIATAPPVPKPRLAERPAAAEPVVVARTERARPVETERVAAAERPVAVVERPIPAPGAAQPVVAVAVRAPVPPPVPRSSAPSHDAVRGLLDQYAAAWRGHDVDTLRAIGQVTSDGQASALRQYFANVGSLQVEVRVLDIRADGDRATVRFTRRDTFRDPTGREIEKESPPIEKIVVTTPQGLRFVPPT